MVFIDETWAKTNMTRTHGWRTKGEALIHKVPHGQWQTLTFIAGLSHDGIIAPCVLDGPINGESFRGWIVGQIGRIGNHAGWPFFDPDPQMTTLHGPIEPRGMQAGSVMR